MRLIDAEKLPLEPKESNQFIPYEYASGWNDMLLNVLKAEQIDAVPVVRCRECKKKGKKKCPMIMIQFGRNGKELLVQNHVSDNFFCAEGERKKGATDG